MVYWLRRGSIAVVALVTVVGIWWVVGGQSETPAPTASATPVASSSATPTAPTSLAPMPTPTGSGVASAVPTDAVASAATTAEPLAEGVTAEGPVACPNSSIQVAASTDKSSYRRGQDPVLTLSITNIGPVACTRDVGPKANSLTITSGGYHVWSSDDCGAGTTSKIKTLKPNKTLAVSITWDGMVTQKGCPNAGTPAKPGNYQVTGKNMKAKSPESSFTITKKKG